ncbi:MAG: DUF4386 domain-containing protein [Candidatus Cybelea sp.]
MNYITSESNAKVSPQVYARTGGVLYLAIFVLSALSMWLQSALVVSNDPAATAHNILASQTQWRISSVAELIMFGCDVPLAAILFVLLRPVSEGLALASALFRFAEAVIGSAAVLLHVAPLALLSGAAYLGALDPRQLQASALFSIHLYNYAFGIALIPFGVHCAILGYLIFRSTYLPKTLGVLLALAGVCYVANSFALIAAPSVANVTFLAMLVTGLPAELGLCIWLLAVGLNVARWNAMTLARSGV